MWTPRRERQFLAVKPPHPLFPLVKRRRVGVRRDCAEVDAAPQLWLGVAGGVGVGATVRFVVRLGVRFVGRLAVDSRRVRGTQRRRLGRRRLLLTDCTPPVGGNVLVSVSHGATSSNVA
jgi:hypothetical protein